VVVVTPDAEDRRPSRHHAAEIASVRRELAEHRDELADLRREVADLRAELAKGAGTSAKAVASHGSPTAPPDDRHTTPAAPKPSRAPQPHLAAERAPPYVDQESPRDVKVALFRRLFTGRDDVYARRWENRAKGTRGWAPVHRGDWQTRREEREYLPLTDDVIISHLAGRESVGLYPLCRDDSCRLLAVDFDGSDFAFTTDVNRSIDENFNQEFHLTGTNLNGRIDWLAGLYYLDEKTRSPRTASPGCTG
jgi:hypothetical protein